MTDPLRLHFNERPDKVTQIDQELPFGQSLWRYPDRQPLEQRLASLNGIQANQILCTNGGDEAIMILMRILNEGVPLILPLPAFSQYTWGVESWQLEPNLIQPKDNLGIDVDRLTQAINELSDQSTEVAKPSAVIILTSPNNPTGEQLDDDVIEALIMQAAQKNAWVFLDEAYIEFSRKGSASGQWLTQYPNLIVLKTLSKAYGMAGIRLGYIMSNERIIEEFSRRCAPFNLPTPTLEIAMSSLSDAVIVDVSNYCEAIQTNREALYEWLVENNIPVINGEANFLMLPVGEARATLIARFLERNGILVRQFGAALSHCVRITIPFTMDKLLACLTQLLTPELICLDMDGVLIDTSDSYDTTIQATFKMLSGQSIDFSAIQSKRNQGGYNNDWVLTQVLLTDAGFDFSLEQVTEAFQRLYLGSDSQPGFAANETPLIQPPLRQRIKDPQTPNFAIVTGRPLAEAKAGQRLIDLQELPVISMDCATPKPSPKGIQRLQKTYGRNTWMCGDNPDDIIAAKDSGSVAIGIRAEQQQALYDVGADVVLASINELENWL